VNQNKIIPTCIGFFRDIKPNYKYSDVLRRTGVVESEKFPEIVHCHV